MRKLFNRINHIFIELRSQIAFYPSLIALAGLIFSIVILYLEQAGISAFFRDNFPILVIRDPDTARTLLSTFIAGLISLMVFSFSMVMILLNQASSNFSPRLLPGLVSNRRHQFVLGVFLSVLIYCIFILVSIETQEPEEKIPGFSVFLAIVLTLMCLATFIYFIHSISLSIQVNQILQNIHDTSVERLENILEKNQGKSEEFPKSDEWFTSHANRTGYFQDVIEGELLKLAKEKETKIHVIVPKGTFILSGVPIIKSEKELEEEEIDKALNTLIYSKSELLRDNYVLAFKQITEIAIKAMSPGINDPGTALSAIDYLTELFSYRMKKSDESYLFNDDDEPTVKLATVSFRHLTYNIMAAFRCYCKHDVIIVQKLLLMFRYLLYQYSESDSYKKTIKKEIQLLERDALDSISNEADKKVIRNLIAQLNSIS
ncbi:DUF2254 domain-containing protein [Robertkochia aurantiaca]|uniref:DUF2254 domain-containing protein n=1 Tax=Robertkochia aurantiaca TaxID=2873700 RepID=UPI001CCDA969|nr:DUF2254 domain-containing protein [Robertkochia sp. 3YJGBD-33]